MKNTNQKNQGFTFIEVLLALAVFAAFSLSAYVLFHGVLINKVSTERRTARLGELIRAMEQLSSDLTQTVKRSSRTSGDDQRVFQVGTAQWQSEDASLVFVRSGWLNPAARLRRSELQRVGYRLYQGRLERLRWIYPDMSEGSQPTATVLLDGVSTFKLRFYRNGTWLNDWNITAELPQAVEVTLELRDYGTITRRFLLTSARISE